MLLFFKVTEAGSVKPYGDDTVEVLERFGWQMGKQVTKNLIRELQDFGYEVEFV